MLVEVVGQQNVSCKLYENYCNIRNVVFSVPCKIFVSANRWRKCEITSKYMKTVGEVLADIAEQTVTPALVTYFEDVKNDICSSLQPFNQCIR